ncbi:aldo/keto reductase [Klebsiella variicola subsp. variicola]|nr:aldo/keto reductase [Klebsiella variicola subsp. variicola]
MRLSRSASIRTSASPSGARWPGASSPVNTSRNQAFPEGSRLANATPFESAPIANREQAWQTLEVMQEIARQRNASVAQVALNWLRTRPGITSLVIGATKLAQLEDNLAALNWTLSDEGRRRSSTA